MRDARLSVVHVHVARGTPRLGASRAPLLRWTLPNPRLTVRLRRASRGPAPRSTPAVPGGSFFMNAGGGTFVGPIDYPYNGRFLGIADVNGDGWPDYLDNGIDGLAVRLNAGDGTFSDVVSYPVAAHRSTESLAIADLNGDCRPDFAAVSEDDVVRVLPNLGDGTFGPADAHAVKHGAYSVAAGDLDGDGKLDLAVTYVGVEEVTVLLNRGCGP